MFSSLLGPTVTRKRADSLPQCRWAEAPWPQKHLPSGREALTPIGTLSPSEVKAQFSISPHQCRVPPSTTSFHLVNAGWGWRLGSPWDLTGTEDKESGHGKREKAISLSARSSLSVVLLRSRWRLRSPQDPTDSTLLEELRSACFFLQGIDYKLPIRPTVSQQGNGVQSASTGQATEDGFPWVPLTLQGWGRGGNWRTITPVSIWVCTEDYLLFRLTETTGLEERCDSAIVSIRPCLG